MCRYNPAGGRMIAAGRGVCSDDFSSTRCLMRAYGLALLAIAGLAALGLVEWIDHARALETIAQVAGASSERAGWTDDFAGEKDALASIGRNPYFILEPGYQLVLEGGGEAATVTVLQ